MFHVFALSADGVVLGDLAFASEVEAMHQAEEFYDAPSGAWQRVS